MLSGYTSRFVTGLLGSGKSDIMLSPFLSYQVCFLVFTYDTKLGVFDFGQELKEELLPFLCKWYDYRHLVNRL